MSSGVVCVMLTKIDFQEGGGDLAKAKKNARTRFETVEEFEAEANAYFNRCDAEGKLYGEAGLALALGVTLGGLRQWYDGVRRPELREAVQRAYLRIQDQIETSAAYMEKGGMATKAIFLLKQTRFGGYQDRIEAKQDLTVNVKIGDGMDESDFK